MTPFPQVIRMVRVRVQPTTAFLMFLLLATNKTSVFTTLLTSSNLDPICRTLPQRLTAPHLLAVINPTESAIRQLYLSATIAPSRPPWSKPSTNESERPTTLAAVHLQMIAGNVPPATPSKVLRVPPCSPITIVP